MRMQRAAWLAPTSTAGGGARRQSSMARSAARREGAALAQIGQLGHAAGMVGSSVPRVAPSGRAA